MSQLTQITTAREPQQYEIDFILNGEIGITETIQNPIEGIKTVSMKKSHGNLWVAIHRIDDRYEFRMLDVQSVKRSAECHSLFSGFAVVHHKFERPTDRTGGELLTSLGWVDPKAAFKEVELKTERLRTAFDLPDSGKMSTPFKELHYYKWLTKNEPNGDHNTLVTTKKYLTSLGFSIYRHHIKSEDMKLLRHCLNFHWDYNFAPAKVVE
jgi:hypothetical protein